MSTTIEFLKRVLLEKRTQSPEKINELIEQAESGKNTLAELLVDKGILRDDELGRLLAGYVEEESKAEDKQAYENSLFGLKVVEKGLAWNTDVWKALREHEKERNLGKVKSIDWFLIKEGRITPEKIIEILDETRRMALVCPSCGRRQILRRDTAEAKVDCKDCRNVMQEAKEPADFKGQDAKEYDPLIGKEVGGCRIESVIGAGGMGTVYKARLVSLNKVVAVKVLTSGEMSESAQKRFVREARTAAKLEHLNVVQTYNTGSEGDLHFIIMQFVDGQTVSQKVKNQGPLPVEEAIKIALDAAKGIQAAHNLGMIHRDIKPDNLMIDHKTGSVKVADFGLAKDLTVESGITIGQQALGTPTYMSPEQARDAASVDLRSDIYSFGATIYAMLAGAPPFRGSSAWAIVSQHMNEPVPDIRQKNPKVPESVWNLILKCMAKKPDDRPKDMAEVLEALLDIQMELRGSAKPKQDPTKTSPTLDLPSAELMKPPQGQASAPAPKAQEAPQKPPETVVPPPAKKGVSPLVIGGAVLLAVAAVVVVLLVILPSLKGGDGGGKGPGDGGQGGKEQPGGGSAGTSGSGSGSQATPASEIRITDLSPKDNSFHRTTEIEVSGAVEGGKDVQVLVYSDPAVVESGRFRRKVKLGEGPATILVSAVSGDDRQNKKDERINVIVDTTPPKLALRSPAASEHGLIFCRGDSLQITVTMIESYPDKVTIDGIDAKLEGMYFSAQIRVTEEGKKVVPVKGTDKAGNPAELQLEVFRDTISPKIAIEELQKEIRGGTGEILLKLSADEPLSKITVNTKEIPINKEGKYSLPLTLKEGTNSIIVEATDLVGNTGRGEATIEFLSDLMLSRMKDEEAWKKVLEGYYAGADEFDKIAIMKDYVAKFPEGTHFIEAGEYISKSRKAGLPEGIVRTFQKGIYVFEKLGVELVKVEAGTYPLGRDGVKPEEGPAHKAPMKEFFILRTEITNSSYSKYLNLAGRTETTAPQIAKEGDAWKPVKGHENMPVTNLSWEDASAFAAWAGGGLPTEAQWEAAARGQGAGPYPWGASEPAKETCNCRGTGPGILVEAGTLTAGASPSGAFDLSGNAAEWCRDYFNPDSYKRRAPGASDPVDAKESFSRTIRGGCFSSPPAMCTVTARTGLDPKTRMPWIGFRIVLEPK